MARSELAVSVGAALAGLVLSACTSSPPAPSTTVITMQTGSACASGESDAGLVCLSGTVDTSAFTAPIAEVQVSLYSLYPSGGSQVLLFQFADADGKWAFSGLLPGLHYYLQTAVYFGSATVPSFYRLFGPFTSVDAAAPIALVLKPVELDVLQSGPSGGPMTVSWARAHVFDPSTGAEITSTASVAIDIGDASAPLPWDTTSGSYVYSFPNPPPAQSQYTITTQDSVDAGTTAWQLFANAPNIDGGITSPDAAASPSGTQPIVVGWTPEPVDYVSLELFQNDGPPDAAVWNLVYPVANQEGEAIHAPAEGTAAISIDGGFSPGQYLLNVDFENSSCPPTADGCVAAASAAGELLNLGP